MTPHLPPLEDLPVLEDLPPLDGKAVLVRADLNVPLADGPGGRVVVDDFRIRQSLPTLAWLQERGAKVTVCSHLGRPRGAPDPRYEMGPVRARLAELAPGVELVENLRFDPGEEGNDPSFLRRLVEGQDAYVNDAFGVSHRAHASVVGPPALLPCGAGRLLQREVEVLTTLLEAPRRPFVVLLGGAKVADKLGVLRSLAARADTILVGGGMAATFLAAQGHAVGASLLDASKLEECRALLAGAAEVRLPDDVVALSADGGANLGGRPGLESSGTVAVYEPDLPEGWRAFDIGPTTRARFAEALAGAGTVLWNGPMGVCEDARFAAGTEAVAAAVAACPGFTVVGGGDSVAAIDRLGLAGRIGHVSTGGGATLELLEHGDLPGLAALRAGRRA